MNARLLSILMAGLMAGSGLADSQQGEPARPPAGRPGLIAEPAKVELGEPFVCRLTIAHAAGERASLPDGLALDDSWIQLEDQGARTVPDPVDAERATTTFLWQLCSLEPGERELDGPFVAVDAIDPNDLDLGGGRVIQAAPLVLKVRAALYPQEDAARALAGYSASQVDAGGSPWLPLTIALVVLAAAAWLWTRRARKAAPAPVLLASERLAAIADSPLDTPEAVQQALYNASHLVREQYDRALGSARDGLTDEEWTNATAPDLARLGLDVRGQLAELARTCGEVKYGPARPTHWAARETLALARGLAQQIETVEQAKGQAR